MGDRIEIVLHDVENIDIDEVVEKLAEVLCGSTGLFKEYMDGRIKVYVHDPNKRLCFELSIGDVNERPS